VHVHSAPWSHMPTLVSFNGSIASYNTLTCHTAQDQRTEWRTTAKWETYIATGLKAEKNAQRYICRPKTGFPLSNRTRSPDPNSSTHRLPITSCLARHWLWRLYVNETYRQSVHEVRGPSRLLHQNKEWGFWRPVRIVYVHVSSSGWRIKLNPVI